MDSRIRDREIFFEFHKIFEITFLKSGLSQLPLNHNKIEYFGKFCYFYNPTLVKIINMYFELKVK